MTREPHHIIDNSHAGGPCDATAPRNKNLPHTAGAGTGRQKTGFRGDAPGGNPGKRQNGIKKWGFPERRPPGSPKREDKKWASREPKARPGGPIRLKRRRATLPHPLECSTIAAPGLSYRVRNGTGRLTRAMTTAKPRSRNDNQNMAAIPAIQLSCGGLGTG